LASWQAEGVVTTVSVNVTAPDFDGGDLPDRVFLACVANGVSPSCIELEIVEGDWLEHSPGVLEQLARLRREGVRIAIDDFGVGYSNFSYLYTIPFDILKIDQALVRGFLSNARQEAMLTGIIRLCSRLGIVSVAEGVETVDEHAALFAAGCQEGQGYFYAEPLSARAFEVMAAGPVSTFRCDPATRS